MGPPNGATVNVNRPIIYKCTLASDNGSHQYRQTEVPLTGIPPAHQHLNAWSCGVSPEGGLLIATDDGTCDAVPRDDDPPAHSRRGDLLEFDSEGRFVGLLKGGACTNDVGFI